jgi:DNA-binding NtrC family response regulator
MRYSAMQDRRKVLIVDDEPNAVRVLSVILKDEGYHVLEARDVDSAISTIQSENVDAIITDLKMPAKDGFQLFQYVSERHPDIPVVFLTAYGTVESAVQAMRSGAYYYFIKPPDYPKLKNVLARALDHYSLKKEFETLKKRTSRENNIYSLIGKAPSMAGIVKTIASVKDTDSSVLIQGETGTGKEVVACNLHYGGKRYDKPFIAVNCAAIPRELMESELFGFDKGAFTGAASNKAGKFETAAEGTIFLDEISELELTVQAKLLRVLQEREVERLGSNRKVKVNFRLISSTNRDLKKEVDEGRFREDLYYRINVIQINVPPLRERTQDIPLLATEFLNGFSVRANRPFALSDEVMDIFMSSAWPGNVRQLRNVLERAVVLAKGDRITARELPEEFLNSCRKTKTVKEVKPLKDLELQAINDALLLCSGNKSKAAKQLGISRKTFYKRLKEL